MTRLGLSLACLLLLSACAAQRPPNTGQTSQRSSLGADLVSESARALRELRAATPLRMLDYALEDARAVIVLPGLYQAGFFYSLHGGSGVLVTRNRDGGWGAPAFVGVGGAGVGVQIGLEKQRLVLVVEEQEMLERILRSGLNFDAMAKFDVLGVREETGPGSLTERRPVLAFTDGVGLMAGVALRGALLTLNEGLTQAYHGQDQGDAQALLKSASAPGIEVFELWAALRVDLPQEQIQRVGKGLEAD
ncbi:MAG: lipid-binding SYLF domain-containing protein [Humidesulfovibrio sp.]|nr:hypothetical protein [Desulfovibrio sp.]MDO9082856.1 lipid-binding SYLF domain-containing protein [Humidesulfovibrio sp.]